jgi:hypothetical protein
MLVRDKHSSLLGPFISYEKIECCDYAPRFLEYHVAVVIANIAVGLKSFPV